jgi:Protein of unknown function (DUF3501)
MQPLTVQDLWPTAVYEGVREQFRAQVIAAKKDRRVHVGPVMTLIFENRLTVKFQVQEILRAERVTAPEAVAMELQGFNEMLPERDELSATLMIELTGSEPEVAAELKKLNGLSTHLFLELGDVRRPARFDPGRDDGQRISAVQYVRFPMDGTTGLLLDLARPAHLVVDHANYSHRTALPEGVRRSLAADLDEGMT